MPVRGLKAQLAAFARDIPAFFSMSIYELTGAYGLDRASARSIFIQGHGLRSLVGAIERRISQLEVAEVPAAAAAPGLLSTPLSSSSPSEVFASARCRDIEPEPRLQRCVTSCIS